MESYDYANKGAAIESIKVAREKQFKIQEAQDELLRSFEKSHDLFKDVNLENYTKEFISFIENEITASKSNNQTILTKKDVPFEIKFNKNGAILEEIVKWIQSDENVLTTLLEGKLPKGFANAIPAKTLPTLGEKDAFWGSSKPTILSTTLAMLKLYNSKHDSQKFCSLNSQFKEFKNIYFEIEAKDIFDKVNDSSFVSKHHKFGFIHSGFAFGGCRNSNAEYKPYDCSSFIEKIYDINDGGVSKKSITATTADFYALRIFSVEPSAKLVENWKTSPSFNLQDHFEPVKIGEAEIGDVVVVRSFSEDKPQVSSFGVSGHCGICVGNTSTGAQIVSANRDMPGLEGIGLQNMNYNNTDLLRTMCFSYKGKKTYSDYDFVEFTSVPEIVEYLDLAVLGNAEPYSTEE